jgi:hypothetical protein
VLAACLCFKDSAAYLDEWLRFHFVQGFRRFYLYNNGSTDDWRQRIAGWIRGGWVVARDFPGLGVQARIYDDCLAAARGEAAWLAFLDDDEFLFPASDGSLAGVLERYGAHAGVAVSWMIYGSSGAAAAEPRWVTERFLRRAAGADNHVKCVVRPERVVRSHVIGHAFVPAGGFDIVDESGRPISEPLSPSPSAQVLRINHYMVKSWEEWRLRRSRPQADSGIPNIHPESSWRQWDEAWSSVEDRSALRFLQAMRDCTAGGGPAWRCGVD